MDLRGGSLTPFEQSMAQEIEKAFSEVRQEAGYPPLPPPVGPDGGADWRNRRILFVAIARGVINHLTKNPDAFEIKLHAHASDGTIYEHITSPTIKSQP